MKIQTKTIIIVEGIDRVGKTTLVEKLKAEQNKRFKKNTCQIIHENETTDYSFDAIQKRFLFYDIFDRSVIGEHVWSKVFNRKPRITLFNTKKIFEILKAQGFKFRIILKMTNITNIIKVKKDKREILNEYDEWKVFHLFIDILNKLELNYEVFWEWE